MSEAEFKRGGCTGCGACCRAIVIGGVAPGTVAEWKERKYGGDKGFIAENWTEIDREQAFKINPYLKLWAGFHWPGPRSFFTCQHFQADTNRCGVYENRPEVCRGYPHYAMPGHRTRLAPDDPLYAEDCGYSIDRERLRVLDVLQKALVKIREESLVWKADQERKAAVVRQELLIDKRSRKARARRVRLSQARKEGREPSFMDILGPLPFDGRKKQESA